MTFRAPSSFSSEKELLDTFSAIHSNSIYAEGWNVSVERLEMSRPRAGAQIKHPVASFCL